MNQVMYPLERGRSYYRVKKYHDALDAFSQAVRVSTDNLLLIALDHRAATFEKLGQIQHALKDAKKMIDIKPLLSQGYLRCAKILQLKGEDELALKIFERGLKKVRVGADVNRTLLQAMYQKLLDKRKPREPCDLLVLLPRELAEAICQYLKITDLVKCLSVSKSWKRFLESCPNLWTTLDVNLRRGPFSHNSLVAYLRRSNHTLHSAKLYLREPGNYERVLRYLLQSCRQLKCLEVGFAISGNYVELLSQCPDLHTLISSRLSSGDMRQVTRILDVCKRLEHAQLLVAPMIYGPRFEWPQSLHLLKSLRLACVMSPNNNTWAEQKLPQLAASTPALTSLSLQGFGGPRQPQTVADFSAWPRLETLSLRDCFVRRLGPLPPTLKRLDLTDCMLSRTGLENYYYHHHHDADDDADSETTTPSSGLRNIESLICTNSDVLSPLTIRDVIAHSSPTGPLTVLHLGGVYGFPPPPLSFDYSQGTGNATLEYAASDSVEDLSLADQQWLAEELAVLARHFPGLRLLDCSRTGITGAEVKELVLALPRLRWLGLNNCRSVSPDAVDWARARGIEVEKIMTEQAQRGWVSSMASMGY